MAAEGGLEFDKMPNECGVEILMLSSSDAATRATWRVCMAGTRVLTRSLLAVDNTSLPTRIRISLVAGMKGWTLVLTHCCA